MEEGTHFEFTWHKKFRRINSYEHINSTEDKNGQDDGKVTDEFSHLNEKKTQRDSGTCWSTNRWKFHLVSSHVARSVKLARHADSQWWGKRGLSWTFLDTWSRCRCQRTIWRTWGWCLGQSRRLCPPALHYTSNTRSWRGTTTWHSMAAWEKQTGEIKFEIKLPD